MLTGSPRCSPRARLDELLQRRRRGELILAAGVGMGLSARAAADAGADLIVAYHSAPLRLAGHPSVTGILPVTDANDAALQVTREAVAAAPGAAVVTSVLASDPARRTGRWLGTLAAEGACGVLNAPPATLLEGGIRAELERSGLGWTREVELIREARARDMIACAYCFDPGQAAAMAEAGADIIIGHLGITSSGGGPGDLAAAAERLREFPASLPRPRRVLILAHGGPIVTPADLRAVLDREPGIDGFFGVSSIERIPITNAIADAVRQFKACAASRSCGS